MPPQANGSPGWPGGWALAALAVLAALAALPGPALARAKMNQLPSSTRLLLDNGFEAILIPNRTAPLVTSVVLVRAGSALEVSSINGISHMLEHLLFNGTARRTQEQILEEQDRYGIINNAHTSSLHTAYFVMAAREMFGRALDLQADMLFGSTFPEGVLAKERDIIANEIAKERLGDEAAMTDLYASRLYHPTGLALPVIGTPESVRSITRQAILDYYRCWYVPNNMTAVIMGDFDPKEMEPLVRRYFGAAAPGLLRQADSGSLNRAALGLTHARSAPGQARLLWLGAPAPGIGSDSFGPAYLLASLLGEDLARAANARISARGAEGTILQASVELDAHGPNASMRVRALLEPRLAWADASTALLAEAAQRLAAQAWRGQDLDRLRLQEKASLMRLWEKPHYFGLDRAPYIAAAGWEYARDFVRGLSWVEPADLKDAARALADPNMWAIFMVGPDPPQDHGAAAAAGSLGAGAGGKETPESRSLVRGWKGPQVDGAAIPAGLAPLPAGSDGSLSARTLLTNSLMIAMDVTDDSRVFAAHVLIRNRAAAEPPGKAGLVELLHRVAGSGTRAHPGPALAAALGAIGGSLKVTDDPAIPYDDIYLSPEYSYIRLEALDEFAAEAVHLLGEILYEPLLDDEQTLSWAREQLLARARQARASPRDRARLLLSSEIWGTGHPFASPLFGTEESIRSITAPDLVELHKAYFSPRNMVIAIGTSVRPERLLPVIEAKLGRSPFAVGKTVKTPPAAPPAPLAGAGADQSPMAPGLVTERLEAPQTCIVWGRLAPPGPRNDSTLIALAAVLARRIGKTLREERGLAYSLGADASPVAGRVQVTVWMGVLPDQMPAARAGLRDLLVSMVAQPPSQQEVDDAVRSDQVQSLMRKLSRINRAYGRCLEELRRERAVPPAGRQQAPAPVSAEQVAAAARLLLDEGRLDRWDEVIVGPILPGEPD